MIRTPRLSIFVTIITAGILAATPLLALAHGGQSTRPAATACKTPKRHVLDPSGPQQVLRFGSQGGNMRPSSTAVQQDGTISVSGPAPSIRHLTDAQNTMNGILALSDATGFWTMSKKKQCPGLHPDVGGRFIQIQIKGANRTVTVNGTCSPKFAQLYAVIQNATGSGIG